MKNENTELLVASPRTIRSIAADLRSKGIRYLVERIEFINFNHSWKGRRGIGLRITNNDYHKLFNA